jgi:MFS family permease
MEEKTNISVVSENRKTLLKVAVISTSAIAYFASIVNPILGELSLAFPDADPVIVRSVATLPSAMLLIFSFISERITRVCGKRKVLLMATSFMFVGGIAPAFASDLSFILTMRLVYGIGYGMGYPLAIASIMDYFIGEERVVLIGRNTGIGAILGIFLQLLGGCLAAVTWRFAFWGYLLVTVVFLLVFFGYPRTDENGFVSRGAAPGAKKGGAKLEAMSLFFAILSFFTSVGIWAFYTNVAIVCTQENIANSVGSSVILSVYPLMTFIVGLVFGSIFARLRYYTGPLGLLLLGLGFLFLSGAHSFILFVCISVMMGIGFGMYFSTIQLAIGAVVKNPQSMPIAVSSRAFCMGLGQFTSPYIMTLLTQIAGVPGGRGEWKIAMCICLAASLSMFLVSKYNKL